MIIQTYTHTPAPVGGGSRGMASSISNQRAGARGLPPALVGFGGGGGAGGVGKVGFADGVESVHRGSKVIGIVWEWWWG